jgi:hypothetical protein
MEIFNDSISCLTLSEDWLIRTGSNVPEIFIKGLFISPPLPKIGDG